MGKRSLSAAQNLALKLTFCGLILVQFFQNCSPFESGLDQSSLNTSSFLSEFTEINKTIIERRCVSCHNAVTKSGNVDLSSYAAIMASGTVRAFSADTSSLYISVSSNRMPSQGPKLTSAEVDKIRKWVDDGASELTPPLCEVANDRLAQRPLPRLSNWEYRQIILDVAPDVFTASWNPKLLDLQPANGFDNRVNHAVDIATLETYITKAEEITPKLISSETVMRSCPQTVRARDRNWDNCAKFIVESLGQKLFRRPLRNYEMVQFKNVFNLNFNSAASLISAATVAGVANRLQGTLDSVALVNGKWIATGWVADPQWDARNVDVDFYIRRNNATSPLERIATRIADRPRADVNQNLQILGDHGFQFEIPAIYADGSIVEFQAIGRGSSEQPLTNSPKTFTSGTISGGNANSGANNLSDTGQYATEFKEGLSAVMVSLLTSSHFLYKPEFLRKGFLDDESGFEVASKLSFLTRNSFPDEALFTEARSGPLNAQVLQSQSERLLNTYANRFAVNFAGQWLNFRRDLQSPNAVLGSMAQESNLVFNEIFQNNEKVQNLLQPGFTFVDSNLVNHYELSTPATGFQKIITPWRGGILTQGHFLVTSSGSVSTNPIKRGIWTLDKILCRSLPDLTAATFAEIAAAKENIDPTLPLENRMALHRNTSTRCYTCHSQIDPMGLPLERFDHLGRYRSGFSMTPIPFGSVRVKDPESVAQAVGMSGEFRRCVSRKLQAYFSGVDSVSRDNTGVCRTTEDDALGLKQLSIKMLMKEVQ